MALFSSGEEADEWTPEVLVDGGTGIEGVDSEAEAESEEEGGRGEGEDLGLEGCRLAPGASRAGGADTCCTCGGNDSLEERV